MRGDGTRAYERGHDDAKGVRLPANYELVYRQAVAELEMHLSSSDGNSAREAINLLIDKVVVQAGDQRSGKHRDIQLEGDLFRMLAFAEAAVGSETANKGRALNAQKPRSVRTEAFVLHRGRGDPQHPTLAVRQDGLL